MNMRILKIILTFLFGCTFGILMVLSATSHLDVVASICGVLSVILLVACGILIGEDS
jgi:hypothetical protein